MHPRDYSFVKNGPDCVCGHARVDHVGAHPRYGGVHYDVACQVEGCAGCPNGEYQPLGPLHPSVLAMHDLPSMRADQDAERKVVRRLRHIAFAALGASIVWGIVGMLVKHRLELELLALLVGVLSLAFVAVYVVATVQTVNRLGPPRALMMAASLMPVPLLVMTELHWMFSLPGWVLLVAAVGIPVALVLVWVDTQRSSAEFTRTIKEIERDLDRLLVPPVDDAVGAVGAGGVVDAPEDLGEKREGA